MGFCYFLQFERESGGGVDHRDRDTITRCLADISEVHHALLHEPAQTSDPYLNDGAPPLLAIQLYFTELPALEAALGPHSPLGALVQGDMLPSLAGARLSQQVMVTRTFAVPHPRPQAGEDDTRCTYLVAYEGVAEDLNAWLSHYLGHHPPIMRRFPGIREIEIYSRVDWCGGLPVPRVDFMQRNKVVFDSPDALTAALNSPVRHEMRADFTSFPPFSGRNTHYPMLTRRLDPAS